MGRGKRRSVETEKRHSYGSVATRVYNIMPLHGHRSERQVWERYNMHRKLTLGEKSPAASGTRTRIHIALGFPVGRSTN